jgi:hypothetical protein
MTGRIIRRAYMRLAYPERDELFERREVHVVAGQQQRPGAAQGVEREVVPGQDGPVGGVEGAPRSAPVTAS